MSDKMIRDRKTSFGMPTLIEQSGIEEAAALCQELGLDFVELNMNLPQYQVEELEHVSYLNYVAGEYGIYYTIHLDENLNIADFNRRVRKAYLDTVVYTIRAAKELKVPVLNMHMNPGVHFTLPDRKVRLFEQYAEEYKESILAFRKMCEKEIGKSGITICIENTDGFLAYEKDAIEELLKSSVFALTWDIGHSHAVGDRDEAFLLEHKSRLEHFHIHDAKGKKNHLTLGTGDIDLKGRLELAADLGCRCVVETKTIQALRESVEWLDRTGLRK